MNACELTATITAIANYLACQLSQEQLELLGVSPSIIAKVLRHKNYATTAKHYIDISTDKAIAAVDKISHRG